MSHDNKSKIDQEDGVRWVIHPLSLDKLRITTGHDQAAGELIPAILKALETSSKVVFAAGGESGTGKSEIAYLVGEMLNRQAVATVEWSFDNAYLTAPEEREEKRAEDYDNNVGLNEMNRPLITEIMSCFEQDNSVVVPVIVINEDGSRPVKQITLEMAGKQVLIFDGLYAALVGGIQTDGPQAARIIAMNEKKFNLAAQKERGKETVNEHRMKVLERECGAVRSLWPHVTHKITTDWRVIPYVHNPDK